MHVGIHIHKFDGLRFLIDLVTTASKATATASAAVAASAVTTSAAPLGLGLVDLDGPAVDLGTVHGQSLLGIGGGHGNEGETADGAGLAVGGEEAVADLAVLGKGGADGLLGALEGEVADVELHVRESGGVESTAPGGVVDLGLGLVDLEGAAVELLAVPGGNGLLGGIALAESNESKSTGISGIAVDGQEHVGDGSELPKGRFERIFRGVEGEISNIELDTCGGLFGGRGFVGHDDMLIYNSSMPTG